MLLQTKGSPAGSGQTEQAERQAAEPTGSGQWHRVGFWMQTCGMFLAGKDSGWMDLYSPQNTNQEVTKSRQV